MTAHHRLEREVGQRGGVGAGAVWALGPAIPTGLVGKHPRKFRIKLLGRWETGRGHSKDFWS